MTTADARGGTPLEVRVLGPIELHWRGRPIDVGSMKTRALVARLLVARNHAVSSDRLPEDLWAESEVDAARFERAVTDGRSALEDGHAVHASALLAEALALWRGPAYGQFADEEFARADARRLEELRLAAIEAHTGAELALGHHSGQIGELETLTGAHPLRERLWGQRMLALYRAGRRAEALTAPWAGRTPGGAAIGLRRCAGAPSPPDRWPSLRRAGLQTMTLGATRSSPPMPGPSTNGAPGYDDPETGLFVFTASYLADRGTCCDTGCRHCPYTP